jgi:hypothetical protein
MKYQITICIIFSLLIIICTPSQTFSYTDEPIIVRELKYEVKKNSNFLINVQVLINKESRLQDLYITSIEDKEYSVDAFLYSVTQAVASITQISVTYRIYTGQVLIDIKGELWAISAENCRKVFELGTIEEQNRMLQKKIIKLR